MLRKPINNPVTSSNPNQWDSGITYLQTRCTPQNCQRSPLHPLLATQRVWGRDQGQQGWTSSQMLVPTDCCGMIQTAAFGLWWHWEYASSHQSLHCWGQCSAVGFVMRRRPTEVVSFRQQRRRRRCMVSDPSTLVSLWCVSHPVTKAAPLNCSTYPPRLGNHRMLRSNVRDDTAFPLATRCCQSQTKTCRKTDCCKGWGHGRWSRLVEQYLREGKVGWVQRGCLREELPRAKGKSNTQYEGSVWRITQQDLEINDYPIGRSWGEQICGTTGSLPQVKSVNVRKWPQMSVNRPPLQNLSYNYKVLKNLAFSLCFLTMNVLSHGTVFLTDFPRERGRSTCHCWWFLHIAAHRSCQNEQNQGGEDIFWIVWYHHGILLLQTGNSTAQNFFCKWSWSRESEERIVTRYDVKQCCIEAQLLIPPQLTFRPLTPGLQHEQQNSWHQLGLGPGAVDTSPKLRWTATNRHSQRSWFPHSSCIRIHNSAPGSQPQPPH